MPAQSTENVMWILEAITIRQKQNEARKARGSAPIAITSKWIWQGSYDVWESMDDMYKYENIKNQRMQEAKDLGYIENYLEPYGDGSKSQIVWKLTEDGEAYLNLAGIKFYEFT